MTDTVREMLAVLEGIVSQEETLRAVRIALRYFGGQLVYFSKNNNDPFAPIKETLSKAVPKVKEILHAWLILFQGAEVYFPLEHVAFKKIIAKEIYTRYNGTKEEMSKICREYRISFVQVYRLCQEGKILIKEENLQPTFKF